MNRMGCIIHFVGREADVESLVALSPVEPCNIWRRGVPRSSRPNSRPAVTSGLTLVVSDAEFEDLEQQQADAIQFLRAHSSILKNMSEVAGVEHATLDFGIAMRDVVVQSDHFPADLTAALAVAGCGMELTQFPTGRKAKNLKRYRKALRSGQLRR
ncbi:hypothetical protein [Acidovorax sp. Leaf73]|uniref:hypothetical protein n=1 Tax=Acidovorax sp. Leaf73 TaxID=2876566 RepID=UPI001E3A8FB4|nr:hypothetical protein [Acidovorax sp. Leaf73]